MILVSDHPTGLHRPSLPHLTDAIIPLFIVVRWSRLRKESPRHVGAYLLTSTWVLFYQGGIHSDGLLRELESEEAVVTFMHILLGCLVGMSCFRAFYFIYFIFFSFSSHKFIRFLTLVLKISRNGFFPRRNHLGVHLRYRKPRSHSEMEETRESAI